MAVPSVIFTPRCSAFGPITDICPLLPGFLWLTVTKCRTALKHIKSHQAQDMVAHLPQSHYTTFISLQHIITGPPTHSVGGAVLFCSLASVVTCNTPRWACRQITHIGQSMTSCRLQSSYSSMVTLHGRPVVLHPVRATHCFTRFKSCVDVLQHLQLLIRGAKIPFGDFKKDFRTDATLLGSVFHRKTGSLQHVTALLLALQQSTRDLLWIQSMSVWQAGQCKRGRRSHHVWITTTRRPVSQRSRFLRSQVPFPRLDQHLNCLVADLDGLTCSQHPTIHTALFDCEKSSFNIALQD